MYLLDIILHLFLIFTAELNAFTNKIILRKEKIGIRAS